MKILYGVFGEGMGHAIRSRVMIDHLSKKHNVQIVASRKAYMYLSRFFENIHEIEGYEVTIEDNMINRVKSLKGLIRDIPEKSARNIKEFLKITMKFSPDAVISDFESFSYTFARFQDVPIISIDNIQILDRCNILVPSKYLEDFLVAKAIVHGKLANCYHYIISSFFQAEVMKKNTSLFPPILRSEILTAKQDEADHVLVYQTSTTNPKLIQILKKIDENFIVYGYGENKKVDNITFKDFSEDGFITDLSSATAVIANSGFTLIGEALYLQKPYLAVPLKKQFEQILNGLYIEKLGYGESQMELDANNIKKFLKNQDHYRVKLKGFKHDGNKKIKNKIDSLLAGI